MVRYVYPRDFQKQLPPNTLVSIQFGFNDGFAGWYAIGSSSKCNDFCFWQLSAELDSGSRGFIFQYNANNTADPHLQTQINSTQRTFNNKTVEISSHWTCAMDAVQRIHHDGPFWDYVQLTPPGYFGNSFKHLRCLRAGDEKRDTLMFISESVVVWYFVFFLFLFKNTFSIKGLISKRRIMNGNISRLFTYSRNKSNFWMTQFSSVLSSNKEEPSQNHDESNDSCKKRSSERTERTVKDELSIDENMTTFSERKNEDDLNFTVEIIVHSENEIRVDGEKCNSPNINFAEDSSWGHQRWKKITRKGRSCLCTLLFVFSLIMSVISFITLIELHGVSYTKHHWLSVLTPSCSAINVGCKQSLIDIEKQSTPYKRSNQTGNLTIPLFSYLIASDTQTEWFGSEFPELGKKKLPSVCTEGVDTFETCSSKYGRYSNEQMKKAIEVHTVSQNVTSLVINGDLTNYFHPQERLVYESMFHNIKGLKKFYPSLGNHDYDLKHGGTYGGDQWFGNPKKCNALHAMDYIRRGFCGGINHFPENEIVRYDSKSLAYSWEEGPYHFVHTHFFPTYENSQIGLHSSYSWLKKDIELAAEANLTTILFVHTAGNFRNNRLSEDIVNKKNKVAAVFSGHRHRCLMSKCMLPYRVRKSKVQWYLDQTKDENRTVRNEKDGTIQFGKCRFGSSVFFGGNIQKNHDHSLFFISQKEGNFSVSDEKLFNSETDKEWTRSKEETYIDENDNSMLCQKWELVRASFRGDNIPIFWSGSSSFQVFLKVRFYEDRFIVDAISAEKDLEGIKYSDSHKLPNTVYPFHTKSDLEEVTVYR